MSAAVLIAGGGTGGHLFPGLAVAGGATPSAPGHSGDVRQREGKALESEVLKRAGLPLEPLKASAFRGRGVLGRLKALAQVPPAVWRAMGLIKRHRPGLVLAVGGYAALPLGLAARIKGVPLAVQEQNALAGAYQPGLEQVRQGGVHLVPRRGKRVARRQMRAHGQPGARRTAGTGRRHRAAPAGRGIPGC